jgi:predicted  nucleic acid-binding Zn-ribbon protein
LNTLCGRADNSGPSPSIRCGEEVRVTSDSPELGKGMFGYRKSAVNQILADRDIMLRQAEGRVRAAESKVAELESELGALKDRNTRMDGQLDRLRSQLDALASRTDAGAFRAVDEPAQPSEDPVKALEEPVSIPGWEEPSPVADLPPEPTSDAGFDFGDSEAAFDGLDGDATGPDHGEAPTVGHEDLVSGPSIFGDAESEDPFARPAEGGHESSTEDPAGDDWLESSSNAEPHPGMGDLVYGTTDYSYEPQGAEAPTPSEALSFPYEPDQFDDPIDELPPVMTFEGSDMTGSFVNPLEADSSPAAWELPEDEADAGPSALAEAAAAAAAAVAEAAAANAAAAEAAAASPADEPAPPAEAAAQGSAEAASHASSVSAEAMDLTNRFLTDEIQGILAAAEESASRIVERARSTTQRQVDQSNRLWDEVQAEVSRFAAWREQVEPVIRSVQSKVESVRSQIEEVPERIRQALAPMADSISGVDADLAELAAASSPPLLLTPRGLDAESDPVQEWGPQDSTEDAGDPAEESAGDGDDASGHLAG